MQRSYDYSVSFARVIAMIFIVICHVASHFEKNTVAQFFNVGVQLFFLISGYLYGNKIIKDPATWLFKRYIRLEIPALMWVGLYCIFAIVRKTSFPEAYQVAFIILNLEGLDFIISSMPGNIVIGPWFFTNIMACYMLFLLYQRLRTKHQWADNIFICGGIFPLLLFFILGMLQISTDGALAFFIGVILKRRGLLESHRKYNIIVSIGYFCFAVGMRLVGKRLFDDSVFYTEVIAPGTHVMIAGTILVGVKWLFGTAQQLMIGITKSAVFQHLDRISIYVYISHGWLITPVFSKLTSRLGYITFFVYLSFVVLIGTLLYFLGEWSTKKIEKGVFYLLG